MQKAITKMKHKKNNTMKTLIKKILIATVGFCFLLSCVKEKEPIIIITDYTFSDIKSIFEKNGCSGCHSDITNDYNKVISEWVDLSVDAEKTTLYENIKSGGAMNGYISTASDIDAILSWIEGGAPEGDVVIDTCTGGSGGTDTLYLELPAFASYDETIKPLFVNNCVGCHHEATEFEYDQLFSLGYVDTTVAYDSNLLYNVISSGGSMSSYFDAYERNMVVQWMSYGSIKNN